MAVAMVVVVVVVMVVVTIMGVVGAVVTENGIRPVTTPRFLLLGHTTHMHHMEERLCGRALLWAA